MSFRDRSDAGQKLAAALASYKDLNPTVLALPRGGVLVAAQVAVALNVTKRLHQVIDGVCETVH
jgi:putative phosphoribosyl transferase